MPSSDASPNNWANRSTDVTKHIAVFAAGVIDESRRDRLRAVLADVDLVIAADGGLAHAVTLGLRSDVLVGDLDSADPTLVAAAEADATLVERHPAAKDETDLELALLRAAEAAPAKVTLVGAHGGRTDHELTNLGLIAQRRWFDAGLSLVADDGRRTVHVVHDRVELAESAGTNISVLPWLGPATGVEERGMQWDLTDATLAAGTSQGMSNVAKAPTQHISVTTGIVLVIIDRSA